MFVFFNDNPTTLLKNGPQDVFCLKGASPNVNHILGLGNSGFYSIGGLFPNHLDSVFHFIVDYLLEAVASMRLGFHFIGVGGDGRRGVSGQ